MFFSFIFKFTSLSDISYYFFKYLPLFFIFSKFLLLFQIFYLFFTFNFSSSVVSIFFILATISCLINCTFRRAIPLKCKYNKNRTNIRLPNASTAVPRVVKTGTGRAVADFFFSVFSLFCGLSSIL